MKVAKQLRKSRIEATEVEAGSTEPAADVSNDTATKDRPKKSNKGEPPA